MATGIRTRLTASEGRRFGLTVGAAFIVIAGIVWWRSHPALATSLAALGGVLTLSGLLLPTYLGPVERAWMSLAHAISKVTTPIVMGAMYLLVITPIGFLRCTFGGNPLVHAEEKSSYWRSRPQGSRRSASMSRQF
jgi:hypothetical protein